MKKKTKIVIAIFVILFLILGLIGASLFYIKWSLNPTREFLDGLICKDNDVPCEVTPFDVDEGAYGKSTLIKLEEEGIIRNAELAYYYNRIFGGYSFTAGHFEIPHVSEDELGNSVPITLDGIFAYLSDGTNASQNTVYLSFNEGDGIRKYASMISEVIDIGEEELLAYWNDEDVIRSYMKEYPFLTEDMFNEDVKYYMEGYLFPDSYEFFENSDCDKITRKFLDRTMEIYEAHKKEFSQSRFSVHEVFTLASIIQWESGNPEDSKLIAGVFVTRMDDSEPLSSTVTACYAFDLSKDECYEVGDTLDYTWGENPYNTYMNQGLPPGAICNPNEAAIVAALNPDTSEGYYYFCADMCNGGTVFARTYEEHEYNIQNYYLACDN